MAGYIMTINNLESLEECISNGVYSTILSRPKNNKWGIPQEGTFADYYSMKEGDAIFFFHKRKIYGIGRIVNINSDCKFLNYLDADLPVDYSVEEYTELEPVLNDATADNRCFCSFEPAPYFFRTSVDMDDVLSSNPNKFRILRTMWKVSFIKIDDEETQALVDVILKRNEESIFTGENTYSFDRENHDRIAQKLKQVYRLDSYRLLVNSRNDMQIKHEMAIEAALCDMLGKDNDSPFGGWDYVSHQVAASPFKPIDYMDKMDVFGYRYIPGYQTISKYLVIEIKKDAADTAVIDQIMKYVDWINQEYSHGDYSMIEAFVVAYEFPPEVVEKRNAECIRNFTKGYRPTTACSWTNVRLIQYRFNEEGLSFTEIV